MADRYGLEVTNDDDVVSIDSEFNRLCIFHHGRYDGSGTQASVAFQHPVKTVEPPLFFVRPDSNVNGISLGVIYGGEPGNWTSCAIASENPHGQVVVAAFDSQPISDYGLRLWSADEKLIFDSGAPTMNFTRLFQRWTYTHSVKGPTGAYTNWYYVPLDYQFGDYFMVNNLRMLAMANNQTGRVVQMQFDFASNALRIGLTAFQNPYAFTACAVFGKPVA
ncbi:hypothetical protein J4P02_22345 [Pseudomonas sp. NFXW11]|uniref:hypothetical protein n=1 Tax=Pseudomonas sp. NFXW11 TaxID=2819531 RepID=UPI003CF9A9FF